jgi:spore coat polysaccharide biosynthesis protein SpsF
VTGDAPLVDPGSLDSLVASMVAAGADFCASTPDQPNINEGFEAFTMAALTKLKLEAPEDPVAREHTCTYFKIHPGFVKVLFLPVPEELQFHGARVSVDTPPDLDFLNMLHARLGAASGDVDIRAVVQLLRSKPELTRINADVRQKAAHAKSRTAMIRCDASPETGLGHLVRCLALAEVLRDEKGFGVTFVTRPSAVCTRTIAEHHHRHEMVGDSPESWQQLEGLIVRFRPDVLVLDVRNGASRETLKGIRERTGVLLVGIDDPEEKRLECDLLFYPPVPQLGRMDWGSLHGRKFAGWDWVLLRRQFHSVHKQRIAQTASDGSHPVVLLITMGGSDPAGMTLKAVRALQNVEVSFHAVFVLGGSFCHQEAFEMEISKARYSFEIQRDVAEIGELMGRAELALACFSVTAYELATAGVPGVYLSLTDDHYESSKGFVREGIGISLGQYAQVSEAQIAESLTNILIDKSLRLRMSEAALEKADGLGARRIADMIYQILATRP